MWHVKSVDETPKSQSKKTMAWGFLVRLVSGYSPTTYSCQKSLPFLPLPNLKTTIHKFMESVRPLYSENSEDYAKLQKEGKVCYSLVNYYGENSWWYH